MNAPVTDYTIKGKLRHHAMTSCFGIATSSYLGYTKMATTAPCVVIVCRSVHPMGNEAEIFIIAILGEFFRLIEGKNTFFLGYAKKAITATGVVLSYAGASIPWG